jgi:glycosyltransferase involved in cell wall biosynthesis
VDGRNEAEAIRATVLTSIMAPYRIPVFNALASFPEINLSVVYLARSEPHRQWPTYENEMKYDFKVLPDRWVFKRRNSWSHLSKGILSTIRSEDPDVIVAGGWDQPSHLVAYLAKKRLGYRFIWWVESTPMDKRGTARAPATLVKRFLVRGADALVVPGSASQRYVSDLGAKEEKVFTAVNAVDNAYFEAAAAGGSRDRDPRVFLTVARLAPEKGLEDLLAAWSQLKLPRACLRIVGDGPLAHDLQEMVRIQGLKGVELVGHLDRARLLEEYRGAHVLVLPSHSEPWGLVVNEAMAAGLPVVASSAVGSAQDLVLGKGTGIVFPSGDRQALANALRTSAAWDADQLGRLGLKARSLIAAFTPERSAAGLKRAISSAGASSIE